jgi:hypothetical protein
MSTLQTTNLKNPSSGSNNIVLGADGSVTVGTITGTSVRGGITSGTAVASTSGTSIDFTSIPSWVKRVTVMFGGTSSNGSSNWQVRLGTSAGVVSTGYLGAASYTGAASGGANSTTGLLFIIGGTAQIIHGSVTFNLLNSSTNYWTGQGVLGDSSQAYTFSAGASVTLPGTLDRVRITTVNGTDTFDAGSVNILYEG